MCQRRMTPPSRMKSIERRAGCSTAPAVGEEGADACAQYPGRRKRKRKRTDGWAQASGGSACDGTRKAGWRGLGVRCLHPGLFERVAQ